jgi:O-antigen/teichoic acid export membrane protein
MTAQDDALTGRLLMVLAPCLPFIYGADVAQPFLNGAQRFTALSISMLIAAAVPSATVLGLLGAGAGAASAIIGYFLTVAAVNVGAYLWALSFYRANRQIDPGTIGYGKRLTLITSLGTLQSYLDKLAVGAILGLQPLAIYSVGKLFEQGLKLPWNSLHQLYFPKLASRDLNAARHLVRATLPYVWGAFAAGGLLAIAATPLITRIVFGETYESSVPVSRILIFGIMIAIPGAQFEILFRSVGDESRLYRQRVTFAVLELLLVVAGSLRFGLVGACWGSALAAGLNSLYGFVLDARR